MPLNFREDLLEALKDPEEVAALLDAVLAEEDPATRPGLLRILAEA